MLTTTSSPRSSTSTQARACAPACSSTLDSASLVSAHSSAAVCAGSSTWVAGAETWNLGVASNWSCGRRSTSPSTVDSGGALETSARNAISCSPASSASSVASPPSSRPRRRTLASTWSTPSWMERASRSRSLVAASACNARCSCSAERLATEEARPMTKPTPSSSTVSRAMSVSNRPLISQLTPATSAPAAMPGPRPCSTAAATTQPGAHTVTTVGAEESM